MQQLVSAFWSIATLRSAPQTLPFSEYLLALVLLGHWLVGASLGLLGLPIGPAFATAFAGVLLMAALVHGILSLRGLARRTVQTLTALAGAEILIGLAALPVTYWFVGAEAERTLPALLSILLLGWNLAVAGHVFRHALDTGPVGGFLAGVGYLLASLVLSDLVTIMMME